MLTCWHCAICGAAFIMLSFSQWHDAYAQVCSQKQHARRFFLFYEWTSSPRQPHARLSLVWKYAECQHLSGTKHKRGEICFTKKVAPNCLPALRKQNSTMLGTCDRDAYKKQTTRVTISLSIDGHPPPSFLLFQANFKRQQRKWS